MNIFLRPVRVLLLLWLALPAAGCGSLVQVTRTEPTPIPLEPRPAPELRESLSRQAAYARDVLARVRAAGAEAGSAAVAQAERAARFVETALGAPARRLEVEEDESGRPLPAPQHDRTLRHAERQLAGQREARARYLQSLDRARAEQMGLRRGTEVSSGWLRRLTGLGGTGLLLAAALLVFLVPNQVLVLLIRSAVGAARAVLGELALRATGALNQVVEGVQRAKGRMDPGSVQTLHEELNRTTSPTARRCIARIKEDVKDKLHEEEETHDG